MSCRGCRSSNRDHWGRGEIGQVRGMGRVDRIDGVMNGDVQNGQVAGRLGRRHRFVPNRGQRVIVPIDHDITAPIREAEKYTGGDGEETAHSILLPEDADRSRGGSGVKLIARS